MKRKLMILLAAASVAVLVLTACSSSDHTNGNASGNINNGGSTGGTVSQVPENQVSENQGSVQENESLTPSQGEPGYDIEPEGTVIPDEDADAAENENVGADMWSGSYEDSDESVSVQLQDDGNISFSFAQSGIYGTAEVNGTQAVFHGDDYHVVIFNISGDTLEISVASEEDFDASASPLNGTYIRK